MIPTATGKALKRELRSRGFKRLGAGGALSNGRKP